MDDAESLEHELDRIRQLPNDLVRSEFDALISAELAPPASFWESYNEEQITIGLRACLLLWKATSGRLVPREFQLQATIALFSGLDCLVDVGTGYGKTLCMILPCLLCPENIYIIVSPLKRLQAVQVRQIHLHRQAGFRSTTEQP
ncbi:hypothetical protein BJ912DRAFT_869966 [Pholiota molesta]|jgi:ATP-dependent helicase YprA (DUF1998 family)|nr:hypothetical protein BJ912DRAFT_869966 [Pholiota molesta]